MKKKKTKRKNKKTKKVTFWGTIRKAISEAIKKYRTEMRLEVEKHKLLSSKSDWSMIESFVQQMNSDPNLKVDVTLNDGTRIQMRSYVEKAPDINTLLEFGA